MGGKIRRVTPPRNLRGLGRLIRDARASLGMSVTDAALDAGIGKSTWERAEDGLSLRDYNYGKIERTLQWRPGSIIRWLRNGGPVPGEPDVATATMQQLTPRDIIEELDLPARLKRRLLFDLDEFYGDGDDDSDS